MQALRIMGRRTVLPRPYWGYEDVGIFCLILVLVSTAFRFAVRFRLLSLSAIAHPPVSLQLIVVVLLGTSLVGILRIRHQQPVLLPLGLFWPARKYMVLAVVLGASLAGAVSSSSTGVVRSTPSVHATGFIFLGVVLGPLLEECFFRGLLLPLVSHNAGDVVAVAAIAVLFAVFHGPSGPLHWASLIATGIAYGYVRIVSRSTTAAVLAHGMYNLVALVLRASWR